MLLCEIATNMSEPFEVLKNPRPEEIGIVSRKIDGAFKVNFSAFPDGNVYFFRPDILHTHVIKKMDKKHDLQHAIYGTVERVGKNNWLMDEAQNIETLIGLIKNGVLGADKILKNILKRKWNFLDKYMNKKIYFDGIESSLEKYRERDRKKRLSRGEDLPLPKEQLEKGIKTFRKEVLKKKPRKEEMN